MVALTGLLRGYARVGAALARAIRVSCGPPAFCQIWST